MIRGLLLFLVLLLPSIKAHAGYYYEGNCYADQAAFTAAFLASYPRSSAGVSEEIDNTYPTSFTGSSFVYKVRSINLFSGGVSAIVVGTTIYTCTAPPVGSAQDLQQKILAAMQGISGVSGTTSASSVPVTTAELQALISSTDIAYVFGWGFGAVVLFFVFGFVINAGLRAVGLI